MSRTQAEVALSASVLSKEERASALAKYEDIVATKSLTAEELLNKIATETGSQAEAMALLRKAKLITAKEVEAGGTIVLTEAKKKEILASELLNAEDKKTILNAFGVSTANGVEAFSFETLGVAIKSAAIAMKEFLLTNPVGWAILAVSAIVGLVKVYDALTVSEEEHREKLENLKSEYNEAVSDIKSVSDELSTVNQKIAELQSKGTLTFTEKEEYDNLVKQSNELQRQVDLLKQREKVKRRERDKEFVQTTKKNIEDNKEYLTGDIQVDNEDDPDGMIVQSSTEPVWGNEQTYVDKQLELRQKYIEQLSKATTEDERKIIQDNIDDVDKILEDLQGIWDSDAEGIDYYDDPSDEQEKQVNEYLDKINDMRDKIAIATGGDKAKTNAFNRLVDNWQFDEVTQELQDLGKEGKVTADMLDDPKYDKFIDKLVELKVIDSADNLDDIALAFNNFYQSALNASDGVNKTTDSLSKLKSASESIATLQKAFKELSDDGYISLDSISKIKEVVGGSIPNWDEYQDKLINAKAGTAEFNQIMSDLTYTMLEKQLGGVEQLANADEDYVAAILRENGVLNANAVAHDAVTYAQEKQRIETETAAATTADEVMALAIEASQAGITGKAIQDLILKIINFSNSAMSVEQKVEALQKLGFYAGWAAEKIASIGDVKHYDINGVKGTATYDKDGKLISFDKDPEIEIPQITIPQFSGGSKSGGSGKSAAEKEADAAKEALEALKEVLEMRQKILDRYKDAIDLSDFGLGLADDSDFALKTDMLNNKLSQITSYGKALREEFDRVASIIPSTGDEAEALGSTLKTLGDNMRSNVTALRETIVAMEQLKIESITFVADKPLKELDSALDSIEKRMELLRKDNKEDYKYTNQILSLETLLPTSSDLIPLRNMRRGADQDIIRSEQATQDTLNDILTEQIAKNENLREDERQRLLANMDAMRSETKIRLDSANIDYDSYAKQIQNTTDAFTSYVTAAVNGMSLVVPKPDTSNFQKAADEIRRSLDEINRLLDIHDYGGADGLGIPPYTGVAGRINTLNGGTKGYGAVAAARSYLGTPYVWGGQSKSGVDCSGLTSQAYAAMGIDIGRTTYAQYANTTRITADQLKPGDLIFNQFGAKGIDGPGHVGMYMGGGRVISAPRPGTVVKENSLSDWKGAEYGRPRYATGTTASSKHTALVGDDKGGKLDKIRPELVVGKDGVRLVGTHGAEFVNLEKGDQVIPYDKTKKILNRSGGSMPRYYSGKPATDPTLLSIVKRVSSETGIPANVLLAVIDQETGNKWYDSVDDSVRDKNGRIIEKGTSYGYMMLREPGALSDLDSATREMAKVDPYTNVLEGAKLLMSNYNILGDWADAASAYNQGLGGFNTYGRYGIKGNNYYGDQVWDRANTDLFKQAAKDLGAIAEYTGETAENTKKPSPEEQEIQRIQGLADGYTSVIGEATKQGRAKADRIYYDETMSDAEKTRALARVYGNISDISGSTGVKLYEELRKEYIKYLDEAGENYDESIAQAYKDALTSVSERIFEDEERAVKANSAVIEFMDDRFAEIDDYIKERETYGEWLGESSIDYLREKKDILLENKEFMSDKEFNKRMSELNQEIYTSFKDKVTAAIEQMIDDYEREQEKVKEGLELKSSKLNAKQTLLQSFYNVQNGVEEAMHSIDKEIAASKVMYEYLDAETRKLIFNQEDYNKLSAELVDIQSEAYRLQRRYNIAIENAPKEELEAITSEYQRQYEMLMKSYEISKARLEVEKKQMQLNNVLRERNVRMLINGQWQWVANRQDVVNAQNELADAKYNQWKAENDKAQQTSLNSFQAQQDQISVQLNYIDSDLERFRNQWEDIQRQMEGRAESLSDIIADMAGVDMPEVENIILSIGDALSGLVEDITGERPDFDPDINYMDRIINAGNDTEALTINRQRNIKIRNAKEGDSYYGERMYSDEEILTLRKQSNHRVIPGSQEDERRKLIAQANEAFANGDYDTGNAIIAELDKFYKYASGTSSTKSGTSLMGEKEWEAFITKHGRLIPITEPTLMNTETGGMVFNQEQMDNLRNLWNVANMKNLWGSAMMNLPDISKILKSRDNSKGNNGNFFSGDIIINSPHDYNDFVRQLTQRVKQKGV